MSNALGSRFVFPSLEAMLGQCLMAHFRGDAESDEARSLIEDVGVGGILVFSWANDLTTRAKVKTLTSSLQKLAEESGNAPLILAIDQEGGRVQRLVPEAEGGEFQSFPSNRDVGSPECAYSVAKEMGKLLYSLGFTMNLAPCIDVASSPESAIGNRAYNESARVVAACGKEALRAYREIGLLAAVKHFPGHGATRIDSHLALPTIDKSLQNLEEIELLPFRACATGAEAVMMAHLRASAIDPGCCVSLSKRAHTFLRHEIGFSGLILSDSLVMAAVIQEAGSVDEAAILALSAGSDLLILGGDGPHELRAADVKRVRDALVEAVHSGRLPKARVKEASDRILQKKLSLREVPI